MNVYDIVKFNLYGETVIGFFVRDDDNEYVLLELSEPNKRGWPRDRDVPDEYISKGCNLYYFVSREDLTFLSNNDTTEHDNDYLFPPINEL